MTPTLPNWTAETVALFWSKVDKTDGCWLWLASTTSHGYGQVRRLGRNYLSHRVAYLLTHGVIPEGMQLDHLCRNRRCVNPDHLDPVTNQVNASRSPVMGLGQTYKTHCPRGHEYSPENTYHHGRRRHCRACRAENSRRYADARKRSTGPTALAG